jgi:hypothetical protein
MYNLSTVKVERDIPSSLSSLVFSLLIMNGRLTLVRVIIDWLIQQENHKNGRNLSSYLLHQEWRMIVFSIVADKEWK